LDRQGNNVQCSEEAFGLPTDLQMTHPDYVIFVDETGSNTNMKEGWSSRGQESNRREGISR
jgi:hypothetical protein